MAQLLTPQSQSLLSGLDHLAAGSPAAADGGLQISHHDQWTMPDASMAAASWICWVETFGAQGI